MEHNLLTWVSIKGSCGAGRARNLGAKVLDREGAKILLFCDADDCASSTWVAELARPLLQGSADLTGGALRIRSHGRVRMILPKIDYWYRQALFGSNVGITYEAWRKLGGFDESLACCEDTDFAWRASNMGLRIQIVPTAIVDYSLRSPVQEFQQRFRWGRSSMQLLRKHSVSSSHLPGLRSLFLDKSSTGFATIPIVAALGQWLGQHA